MDIPGHTISRERSSMLTGEYINMMPWQSKQGRDDVIIGPQEIGDGLGQGSSEKSEADSITNLETCPCFVFEASASQT